LTTPPPSDLAEQRRFFAEEIEACGNLRLRALVDALAAVPRERFLRPGPWLIRGEGDLRGGPRETPDADPRRVYHNVAVAIDPARQLFNGAPGVVAPAIEALELKAGDRVVHIGAGLGYYTALMAHIVGPEGRVVGVEIDAELAAEASRLLSSMAWVEVRRGDGAALSEERVDAILVSAGVTHPQDAWLDALAAGGRLVLPLTATMPQMGPIGKGPMLLLAKRLDGEFDVRPLTLVAIYSAIGLRDESLNAVVGTALRKTPFGMAALLTRLPHEVGPSCWVHGPTFCFTTAPAAGRPAR
jgi:protein-L-isoaspartate(D-aspartate) O-methyltransferase